MRTVEFKYDRGARVKITDIGMTGRIDALLLEATGEMYRVVYWNDGTRNSVWMYDYELTPE